MIIEIPLDDPRIAVLRRAVEMRQIPPGYTILRDDYNNTIKIHGPDNPLLAIEHERSCPP